MKNGEIMLWREVIRQAIRDAIKGRDPIAKDQAVFWFINGSEDFRLVCDFADLEPDRVREFVCNKIFK